MVEQARRVLDLTSGGEKTSYLEEVKHFLDRNFNEGRVPAILGTEMHRIIKKILRNDDPFKEKKKNSNRAAMEIAGHARRLIREAEDPLVQSFKVALAGNLVDFGVYGAEINLRELKAALKDRLEIDDSKRLREALEEAKDVLYLCDNAGEIVFDKLCIEELKRLGLKVTAVVKSGAIVNDATMEDARFVGLKEVCEVIASGTDCVGVILEESSRIFREKFASADLIIAKGQGHYETMEGIDDKKIAFLLKAKCKPVARALGVKQKSSVVMLRG
jgi:hypothetical protein